MNTKKYKSASEYLEKKYGRLTFGATLKAWRLADEMTQTAYAKKLGISVQNLNDLEHGRKIPSPSRAAKLAKRAGAYEMGWVRIALRDFLYKEGFKFDVKLESA